MQTTFSEDGGVTVAHVQGRLDVSSYQELEAVLQPRIAGGVKLVIDLSGVEFITSAGLRALLGTAKRCKQAGGALRLAAAPPLIKEVFEISGLSQVIPLDGTVDEARSRLLAAAS